LRLTGTNSVHGAFHRVKSPTNEGRSIMIAPAKIETQEQAAIEVYLGFSITRRGDSYMAIPTGWSVAPAVLDGASLPAIRKRIWSWWHRLVD